MKEINLSSGNYLFVEVPDDAIDFKIVFEDSIKYYSDQHRLMFVSGYLKGRLKTLNTSI